MGNTINLSDDDKTISKAINGMPIDPTRSGKGGHTKPGDPDKTVAFIYHRAFNPNIDEVAEMEELYRTGNIGDGDVKKRLKEVLAEFLAPIRARRAQYDNANLAEIVLDGTMAARDACRPVVASLRESMHLLLP